MTRRYALPVILAFFMGLSILTLRSVADSLVLNRIIFFFLGAVLFGVTASIRFSSWSRYWQLLLGALIFSLLITLIIGNVTRGSTRWIQIAGVNIQSSQLAIPIGALAVSGYLNKRKKLLIKDYLTLLGIIGIPMALIFIQPDLSTTAIFLLAVGSSIFIGPISTRQVLMIIIGGVLAGIFAWLVLLQPYQKQRITSFIAIQSNLEADYNSQQSLIAVGSGQFFGRGLGQGVQSHLRFLPERQTDFIFASLAEELGFIGGTLVIGLYLFLLMFMIFIAEHAATEKEQYFLYAIITMLILQTGVNIGMNIGLVPITGVTLPMLSYGGSSVLSLSFTFGLVQSIILRQEKLAVLHIG